MLDSEAQTTTLLLASRALDNTLAETASRFSGTHTPSGALFARAPDAAACALSLLLQDEELAVALHSGRRDDDSTELRCGALLRAAHPGQILVSQAAAELVRQALPADATLRDLGPHRLADLAPAARLFQLCHPRLPSELREPRSLDAFAHNLPVQWTSFVGRREELATVRSSVAEHALVTLTGSGGAGKTRLALHTAASVLGEHADETFVAELAPVTEGDLLAQTVAAAVGVVDEPGRPLTETLAHALRSRELLIVLDGCEHLADACASLIDALRRSNPRLRVLATSREPLGLAGERLVRVAPLEVPESEDDPGSSDAVRLFCDRASSARDGFVLTVDNAPAVADICRKLDGIPLAIELAAARVAMLTPQQVAERLEDRFRTLSSADAEPRQRTLRALIDWSYELLSPGERTVLARLSVFAGGCTLAGAERLCAGDGADEDEVLDIVSRLVDRSLVETHERRGEMRYALLDSVRSYAAEKLGPSAPSLRTRHAQWCSALAELGEAELKGPRQAGWIDVLRAEHDNVRAALRWLLDSSSPDEALRLAASMGLFWEIRGHLGEGRSWLERALAAAGANRCGGLVALGSILLAQGNADAARTALDEALELSRRSGDRHTEAAALARLGSSFRFGDYARARSLCEEALVLYRELGDGLGVADAASRLGAVMWLQSEYARAQLLHEEALALHRAADNARGIAATLLHLGDVHRALGRYDAMRPLYGESLDLFRALGDRRGMAVALNMLGTVAQVQSEPAKALSLHEEGLHIFREMGDRSSVASSAAFAGRCSLLLGNFSAARERFSEALDLQRELDDRRGAARTLQFLGYVTLQLGEHTAARGYASEGLTINRELDDRPGAAEGLRVLGSVEAADGDHEKAAELIEESLAIARDLELLDSAGAALIDLGGVEIARGRLMQAREHFSAAIDIAERTGDEMYRRAGVQGLGEVARDEGDLESAQARFSESLRLGVQTGDRSGIVDALESIALLREARRDNTAAARLRGAAHAVRESIGTAAAGDPVDPALLDAWEEGRTIPLELAVAYALGEAEPSQPAPAASVAKRFRRDGDQWELGWGSSVVRLKDSKGLRCIAFLISHPAREVHCLALAAVAVAESPPPLEALAADVQRSEPGDAERARQTVTHAIRSALRRVANAEPALGHHLSGALKTGTFCSYVPAPDERSAWEL